VRLLAIRTVEQVHLNSAIPVLNERLADDTWTANEHLAIVKSLRVFNDKSSLPALTAILKDEDANSTNGNALRLEALRSVAQLDAISAQKFAEKFLDQKDTALQKEAIQVLGTQPAGAKKVAEKFVARKLSTEFLPQVTEALRKHLEKDPALAPLLTQV